MTNNDRARSASRALNAFIGASGDNHDHADNLSDLLCNLRHFADAAGVDFDDADRRAAFNYEAETRGDSFEDGGPKANASALV